MLFTTSVVWAQDPALVAKGRQVYAEKQCSRCHMIGDEGAKVGPNLTRVGFTRDAEWLKRFLKDPKSVNPRSKMMAFEGTEQELGALAAFLASLY